MTGASATREEMQSSRSDIKMHVALVDITDADVLSDYPLSFDGYIERFIVVVSTPVTTADDLSTLNLQISSRGVNKTVSGTATAMTSANMTPLGLVKNNAATGNNTFRAGDTLNIIASSTTAFAEGTADLTVVLRRAP